MNTDREHLNAETVAAWIDGGLDARSVAAAEAHASNCDRCQALLSTLSATLPVDALNAADEARGVAKIWKWWFAPLAAAAAAVTLWMVVPQDPMRRPPLPSQQSNVSSAPASAPPPATAPSTPAEVSAASPSVPAPADARIESRARTQRKDAEAKEAFARAQSNKAVADTSVREEKQEEPVATLQERVTIAQGAQAPAPAEPTRKAAPLGAAAEASLAKRAAPLEIISPDAQRRWRVASGTIELSSDGGRTWMAVPGSPGGEILAGAAPDAQVCWLVGRQGLVLRATEGTNFMPLPFPERVDLVSVTALDARRATVVTADGRTFETVDNGQNWRIR